MKKYTLELITRLKSKSLSIVFFINLGFLVLSNLAQAQVINDPYCISEFSTFSDKVTEMTVDWDNNLLYFTGENVYGKLYKVGMDGSAVLLSSDFANSAASGLLHNYISTDVVYYNDSIFSNSEGSLIMIDLSPSVTSSNPHVFTGDIGAEAGMAVVGDKIYTTDGKGTANAIYEYDIASNTSSIVVSGLPTDTLHGLEYCEATDKLYLAISPLGIYEVDVTAGTYTLVTDPLPNGSRSNFAIDPTGAYAFVHNGSSVYRYNLSTGAGEVFASSLLGTNFCDLKFGPSSNDPTKYSLYIGGNDRIYEATGFVPATSADTPTLTATQPVICPLGLPSTTISIAVDDDLNGASAWYLYSGSCGGTLVASNTTGVFTVTPSVTTTYYVRGEGECNVAPGDCGEITIIFGDIQPPTTSLTHVTCNGESDGAIEIFASGGASPYEYSIDNGVTFQSGNTFTDLSSGDYNVVVREANGCTNTATVELTEPDPLDLSYTSVNLSCNLGSDGSIEITASGGAGSGYDYSIDNGVTWLTNNTFENLNAGTYYLVVRDHIYNYPILGEKKTSATTCETEAVEVIITEPTAITFSTEQTEVSCNGGNDGSITFSASGGVGGNGSGTYQYSIDGGSNWQDSEEFTGLTAGDYSPAVRDQENTSCIVDGETVTITQPTAITFTTSQTNINCNGGNEGEIIVTASGGVGGLGTATYDYSNDGGTTWQISNTFSNLVAGDYDIVVRDQGQTSCQTSIKTLTITEPTALSFTVDQRDISCNGNNDGQIVVNASGGVGGAGSATYDYSIDGGINWQAEDTFDGLLAGSYNVRIRDKENTDCNSEITTITITQADPLSFTNLQTDVSCNGGSDGVITVTASGGSGAGYDYSKDNGSTWQTSNIFEDLEAGDYEIIIRDQSNTSCVSDAKTVRVEEPTAIAFSITQYDVSCNGGDDGEIVVTANGGVGGSGSGTYQYSNDNGNTWQDGNRFTGLIAKTYNISVRDAVNTSCQTDSEEVIITEPSAIGVETTITHVSCFQGSNGQIEVTATGGEGGGGSGVFDYSIDGGDNWQTLNIFTSLVAGTYSVIVRDQGNVDCTTTAVGVEVLEPTQITFTTETFDIACNGTDNGKIIISASGGVGGAGSGTYQYSNDGGYSWQDSDTFDDLFAATYQVLVRDKENINCSTEAAEVIIAESDPLTFTFTQHDVSCAGGNDGQLVFTASGGSGAGYQYSIDGGANFQESNTFKNLPPDRYTLLIAEKDDADCRSAIQRITITEPTPITFTTEKVDVSCFECDNGVISVSAEGGEGGAGTGMYQYSIDNGDTWQDASVFTALYAGTYQVMVRDRINTGCETDSEEVEITEPTPLTFITSSSNISCNGDATGTITITADGGLGGAGSGTYQYSVDDGTTWSDYNVFNSLLAGSYSVRVRDKVNIVNVTEAEIVEITEPTLLEFTFDQTDVSCNGNSDGGIVFTASGGLGGNGSGTYSYSIDGGDVWQSSNTFGSLFVGEYQLAIRDDVVTSCISEITDTEIIEPDLLELSFTKVDANCSTNDDGEIHLVVAGGTGGGASEIFEYSINGSDWQDEADFTGLSSADYLVTVRDKVNTSCSTEPQDVFVDLISPINLDYTYTEISCNGNNDGLIDMTGLGGSGYEFTIDGVNWADNGLFENLDADDYTLITRESANHLCASDAVELSLEEPTELSFITAVKNATCIAGNDGEITVDASGAVGGAGSGTYRYSNDDGTTWQDSNIFSTLTQGDYLITIQDKENTDCQAPSQTVVVHEYSTVDVSTVSTDISCFEGNDGTISITANGGVDYEYSIDNTANWSTSNLFENLIAETYTVVVREQAMPTCYTEPIILELEEPSEITFTITKKDIGCFGGNDGSISIEASGGEGGLGTATYEYSIDNGASWQTDNHFSALSASTYDVVLRDLGAPTCQTAALSVELTEPTALGFTVNKTEISCYGSTNGAIEIIANGGVGGAASGSFEYSIDGGTLWSDSNIFTGLSVATYLVSVRDKENTACQAPTEEVILSEPSELIFTSSFTHADCGVNNNGEIVLSASGGEGGAGSATYDYSIDGGINWQAANTFSGLAANTYTASIRDKENTFCVSALEDIKIKALSPIAFTHTFQDVSCPGSADGEIIITVSGGATYDYSIDNGTTWQASNIFSSLSGGTYELVVRDQTTPDCESETVLQELFEADDLVFTYEARNESCNANSDGKIEMLASGGASGTFEYTIDGVNWSDNGLFENLEADNYSLIIRDKENPSCLSDQVDISLIKATELGFETAVTPVTCYGFDDGEIAIALTVGSELATYEYSIDNGVNWQLSNTFTNLEANFYYVGIRELGTSDCQPDFEMIILNEPQRISISIQKKDETCDGINDGEIVITSSGFASGNGEYTIDGGLTFQDSNIFTGIGLGNYDVFSRDKDNPICTSDTYSVEIVKRTEFDFNVSKTNTTCNGATDGTITVGLSVGTDLTEYEFSNTNGDTWQEDNIFVGLASGDYTVLVRKKGGSSCISYPKEVTIGEPNSITFTSDVLNESCGGTNDGAIDISAFGGSSLVYDYSADNGISWQSDPLIESLGVATYEIVVRDRTFNNCQSTMSEVSVGKDSELKFVVNWLNVQCFGSSDGRLRVTMDEDSPDVDYEYSIDAGNNWQTDELFTDLPAGNYSVLVRRAGGASCQTAQEVLISQPDLINFTVVKTDITCANDADASIEVNATGGKTSTYQYSLDNGITWQDENLFTGLDEGSYLVLVRDKENNDCQSNPQNVSLNSPSEMSLSVSTYDLWCNSSADGEIYATGSGGSGTLSYSIDGGITYQEASGIFTGLDAGEYSLVLKDANGCELIYSKNPVVLSEPQGVTFHNVDVTYGTCTGGLGSIDIDASSLFGGMLYSIDGGVTYQSSRYFGDLSSDTYNVVVKESDACENAYKENPIELTLASELTVNIVATPDNNICTYYPITLTAEGPDIAQYTWNTTEDTESIIFSTDTPGSYDFTVDVVSDHGCAANDAITLDFNPGSPISITADPIKDDYCTKDKVTLTALADDAISYLWKPDNVTSNTSVVEEDAAGNFRYFIEVTNSTGCISIDSVLLVFKDCTGLNELDTDGVEINIFPNPTNDAQFEVEVSGVKEEVEVWIIDFDGRLILEDKIPFTNGLKLQKQFDLQGFERGVYFIRLATSEKVSYKRIILM